MAGPRHDNLKSFDAYADENGQNMGQDAPTDVADPASLRRKLAGDPGGEAETARLASGTKGEGHDAATAAEAPEATRRLGDASAGPKAPAGDAIERATAALGKED